MRGTGGRPGIVGWLAIAFLALTVVAAVSPGLIAPGNPLGINVGAESLPPSFAHVFGTDYLGRGMYTRIVYGTHVTVLAVLAAVAIAFVIGSAVGLLAGFLGGWIDHALMRVIDMLLAVPSLLLSLAIITALGSGIDQVAIAVGVAGIASFARITRTQVVGVRVLDYIEAAGGSGSGRWSVLVWHIVPNAIGPALVLSTLELGSAVLSVASLSFLGFGEPAPAAELGSLVSDGRNYIQTAWWIAVIPSLVIAAIVVSTNIAARLLDRSIGADSR